MGGVVRVFVLGMMLSGCIPAGAERHYADDPPPIAPQLGAGSASAANSGVTVAASAPPAWEARPVMPDATAIPFSRYTVQPGDTLRAIGNRTGAGSEAIARANLLVPPYRVVPGEVLNIPEGRYHLVRAGETGIAIARAYGLPWSRLVTANALMEPYILRAGQRVLIPAGLPPTAGERAAAFRLDIDDIVTGGEPAIADDQRPAPPLNGPARALASTAPIATPTGPVGRFVWPAKGPLLTRFGPGRSGERNDGIKIALPLGSPVVAAADGVVAYVGTGVPALGGLVMLKHGSGVTTVYGHASKLLVTRGQAVKRGQEIALSGNTGFADRPELHFEVREGRNPVDPMGKLPPH